MHKEIINRELSWLSFNERVLQEAGDETTPVIERLKFLGIFSNNLDEFFKVRVATIKRMVDLKVDSKATLGVKPKKLLLQIQERVLKMQQNSHAIYNVILDELAKENIFIINETQLSDFQAEFIKHYFEDKVLPALAPIMLGNLNNIPFLKDKSIYLATRLFNAGIDEDAKYALVEIPTAVIPRFLVLPNHGQNKCVILLDDVIRFNLKDVFAIFPYSHFEAYTIKLTRDAELDIDNDVTKSFLEKVSKGVSGRKKGQPVRFVYDETMPKEMLKYITDMLDLDDSDSLIPGARYHNFKDFMSFPNIGGSHLEYEPTPPLPHPEIINEPSILRKVMQKDLLLHYPYQKFSHYINLLREAAIDPKVVSVKVTIYRAAANSKVINALINAARNGKNVVVVIELQARFDEKANIYWSRKLEEAGAKVLFGIQGLKVHAKLSLITSIVGNKKVNVGVVSTGNFHEGNGNVYTDVALISADKRIANEIEKLFDYFENSFKFYDYNHLLVSPLFMRRKLVKLIDNEIKNAREGKDAYIILKINNLVDPDMISKLYQANCHGVKIKLIVRGICSLIPGIPGLSENIEAISIVDKFLEHARIFVFCNNKLEKYYISSADWMTRNLDTRIEVASPIYDPELQKELKTLIEIALKDNVKARIIDLNHTNAYRKNDTDTPVRSQFEIYKYYKSLVNNK
ncbi:MAG TPA: polyphosphate kinase 1 [Bacteroidales bacterium]|nr:polyphosphate kinase 1 [Bacteroidales bacterium]